MQTQFMQNLSDILTFHIPFVLLPALEALFGFLAQLICGQLGPMGMLPQ